MTKLLRLGVLSLFLLTAPAFGQAAQPAPLTTVNVWPDGKMPGAATNRQESQRPPRGDDAIRITDISVPTLQVFPAPATDDAKKPAPAMIVSPGGGYSYVVVNKEGTEIASWLNANGFTAIVLKYRCPSNREGALQDIQRALSLTRANAATWNVDTSRLGVIGFSAGGNLSAKASNHFDQRSYKAIDAIDEQSCRPDFAILVYPAYLGGKDGKVATDLNIRVKIPPTLIIHSEDDKSHVVGSKIYNAALVEAKHPIEFRNYPTGGHGYGLRGTKDARVWPQDAMEWLKKVEMR